MLLELVCGVLCGGLWRFVVVCGVKCHPTALPPNPL